MNELLSQYKKDLRSIIQYAAPFACEQLAVELLERFYQEMLRRVDMVKGSDTTGDANSTKAKYIKK